MPWHQTLDVLITMVNTCSWTFYLNTSEIKLRTLKSAVWTELLKAQHYSWGCIILEYIMFIFVACWNIIIFVCLGLMKDWNYLLSFCLFIHSLKLDQHLCYVFEWTTIKVKISVLSHTQQVIHSSAYVNKIISVFNYKKTEETKL